MKGDVWYLKLNGEIQAKFEQTSEYMNGSCYNTIGWIPNDNGPSMPCEWEFFAEVYCKPDSCTHWYFYGEDYYPGVSKPKEQDSYYHLCGDHCFLQHIRTMCFVWKVATLVLTEYVEHNDSLFCEIISKNDRIKYLLEEYFGNEDLKDLVDTMLDGYTVGKGERNEESNTGMFE